MLNDITKTLTEVGMITNDEDARMSVVPPFLKINLLPDREWLQRYPDAIWFPLPAVEDDKGFAYGIWG